MKDIKIHRIKSSNPLKLATTQALYSRSADSLIDAVNKIKLDYGKFVEKYYIQYGHKSIGDCGDVTLMIENISSKASMAIQHNRLYNGQEKSTRYVNFKEVGAVNPCLKIDKECSAIVDNIYSELKWLYSYVYDNLLETLTNRENNEDNGVLKAIEKYALDYARFFLPAGIKTSLSWKTSMSNMNAHLNLMSYGFDEIKDVAKEIYSYLDNEEDVSVYYPNYNMAFEIIAEKYFNIRNNSLISSSNISVDVHIPECYDNSDLINLATVKEYRRAIKYIPMDFLDFYSISINDIMPYANFRDFHRHRTFSITYNLSNEDLFGSYYINKNVIDKLGELLDNKEVYGVIESKIDFIKDMRKSLYEKLLGMMGKSSALCIMDYVCCFGSNVIFNSKCNLNAMNYLIDLRTSPSTHELLRLQIAEWVRIIKNMGYSDLFINVDENYAHEGWYIERANQDIVEKG